jgi:hypothetical protein
VIDFQLTYGGFRTWLTKMATEKPRGIAGTCNSPYQCPIARYIEQFMPPDRVQRVSADGGCLLGLAGTVQYSVQTIVWEQETPRWARLFMQKVDAHGARTHHITYKTALDRLNWAANDMARYYPKEDFS